MHSDLIEVLPRLWHLQLGVANAALVSTAGGLVLVDTGPPGSIDRIASAIDAIGYQPSDIRAVIVTHHHADHAGSLADVLRLTGADAWMHDADAAEVRIGNGARTVAMSSKILRVIPVAVRDLLLPSTDFQAAPVAHSVDDGDVLPGRILALHTPGHTAGHIALLWPEHGGVLLAGDACSNAPVLTLSAVYEDLALGRQSLRRIAALHFDHVVFGHGAPIVGKADTAFRRAFGDPAT